MKLLTVNADAKTVKGKKQGYLTGILYLAPADASGINTCANASPGCRAACLYTAGRAAIFDAVNKARVRKTRELFRDRAAFQRQLADDIRALVRKAEREGLTPCVRLNGTSDLPWLALSLADQFPTVRFYDYTKHPKPWTRETANYHLTFSASETNHADTLDALYHGVNVAMVFPIKRGHPLPTSWNQFAVLDGDLTDLRFTDARYAKGFVIGLRAKGQAKKDSSGFVQIA